jgi:hypothetical protein
VSFILGNTSVTSHHTINSALVSHPSCIPEKVIINEKGIHKSDIFIRNKRLG